MFYQASLPGLHSATSSPGLACGATPCVKPAGQIPAQHGPDPALAKLYGDWRTEESLRLLQQAIYEAGALLYPSQPIQKVWASLSEEEKKQRQDGF